MIRFREHFLIIGATGTGKGVLTAAHARDWLAAGDDMRVFLLTKKQDEYDDFFPGHPRVFKTRDQARLLAEVQKLKAPEKGFVDTLVIIDEAWAWKWKGKNGLQEIPNAARSAGVEMIVQSQFPTQMPPTVRGNCDNVFIFRLREPAAIKWAVDAYGEEFAACRGIPPGEFLCVRGLGAVVRGVAWYEKENGEWVGV